MQAKGYLEEQTVSQIEDVIKERAATERDLDPSSPAEDTEISDKTPSQKPSRRTAPARPEKRQIEQRIEEDRERHKRERESIWAIPSGRDAEANKLWEDTSDFGEDDDRLITEESQEFLTEMEMQKCDHQQLANGGQSTQAAV